ncbi:uncharacterized protein LOC113518525 [Galleria mellonella]|uniref:Uncharacterized protein LOC113518525 n=1 Tax=Galleria mellonella TaxID=7137 RepID=A0A6J1X1A2_GALME|nr:uncharacterized protein LOC113518525 [Galleria mellonella]
MGIKQYFSNEFSKQMWFLEHDDGSDFYVSSLQSNRSCVPLLCARLIIFIGCLGILLSSIILDGLSSVTFGVRWPVYLTHWGLIFITVTSGLSLFVSIVAYKQGSIDTTLGLPWYIKVYWVLYNATVPIALFITVFYWILLASGIDDYAMDPVLDLFIHAINSVLMLILLLLSHHPSHILHFFHPISFTFVYLVFTIIYYHAGGTNPWGGHYIYPQLDWSKPGSTVGVVFGSAFTLIILHLIVVLLSVCRDWFSKRFIRNNRKLFIHEYKMSVVKRYFKDQMQWRNLGLEYSEPATFYLSVWQTTRSSVPLLIFRGILFLTSLGIVLSSIIIYSLNGICGYWFIYLTHWGLTANLLATGFATVVSARCYFYGPISTKYRIPWYLKTYWVVYNVATPVAFLITIFYWSVLYEAGIEEELNHGLDVAVHGLNTIVMFLLLITCSQPSFLLHLYQPLLFALTYFFFTLIYYLARGVDNKGNRYIYPVLNWQNPGITIAVGSLTGVLLVTLYFVMVGMAAARDAIATRVIQSSVKVYAREEVPLSQPVQTAV